MPTFITQSFDEKQLKLQLGQHFVLEKNNWDDFGSKTLYELDYINEHGECRVVGAIKILQKEEASTKLKPSFEVLDERYVSLGQSIEFYKDLIQLCGQNLAIEVLQALRDVAWTQKLAETFETDSSFRNSLLRENKAEVARRFGQAIINKEYNASDNCDLGFSFSYTGVIPRASESTTINVDFDPDDPVPGRIVGVIGRNATGKTQYLAQLANDLVHNQRLSEESKRKKRDKFSGDRPLFNRVITISYSVFDKFLRPSKPPESYVYCGIRNNKGNFSPKYTSRVYRNNRNRIVDLNREQEWISFMSKILNNHDPTAIDSLRREIDADPETLEENDSFSRSSGQAILGNLITSLLAWIEPCTLVLFDEPEMHLHPNAVANLFCILNTILQKYDSFALLATHSPLVIQELPSKRVIVFDRVGNVTEAKGLLGETFGENLSDLTRHIFKTFDVPPYYKMVLNKLSENKSYDDVLAHFPLGLSINARSYLLSRYSEVSR